MASHHGTIALGSAPGGGTVFTIELPLDAPPEPTASAAPAPDAARPVARRILVIDDEPEILEILAETIGTEDVTVDTAADGVRATPSGAGTTTTPYRGGGTARVQARSGRGGGAEKGVPPRGPLSGLCSADPHG